MKLEKLFLITALVAIILAVPVAYAMKGRTHQLKIERSNSQQLQLKVDSVEKQLQEKQDVIEQQKTENEKLKADLQAKLKRQEEAKLAAAEQARKAPVAVSAGGASYSGAGNCESYRSLVSQYAWNVDVALSVMRAESGCNPNAANWNDSHNVCTGSFGLFQISCHSGQVYDPAENVRIAYAKYSARGWQPWGVCTSGKVSCY